MNAPDERRPVFRQACADDLPALFALAKAADENGRLTQADLRRGLKVHAAGQWVLEADGQVVAALHSVRLPDIASLEGVALRDVVQRHDPEGAIALVLAWAMAEDVPADATRLLLESALATLGASPGVTRIVAVASCEEGELPEDGAGDDAARWSAVGARLAILRDLGASLGHRMPGYRGKTAAHQGCGLLIDFAMPGAVPKAATPLGPQLFVLSAATTERLRAYAQKVLAWLGKREDGDWFRDAIHTWQVGRTPMKQRLALEVRDSAELQARLQAWIAGTPVYPGTWSSDAPPAPQAPATPSALATMAMAWVAGEAVSWRDLHPADAPSPRRIAVPTYPFAATRHWFTADTDAPTPVAAPEPPAPQTVLRLVPAWEAQPMEAGAQGDDDKPARHLVLVSGFSQLALSAAENTLPDAEWQRLPTPVADDGRAYVEMVQTTLHAIRSECEARRDGWVLIQVLVEDDVEAWVAGGLSGLLRTAAEEYGDCVGQVIFSDAGTPQEIARQLGYEARHGHAAIVRYRAGSRQRRTWRTVDEAPVAASPLRRGGVYCITGGLGGIGMHVAGELLHRGRGAKVVLLGRSPLAGDALTRFEYLQALAAAHPGASIHYRMVDISDSRAVWGMVADIVRLHGHLNGIVHAAGVLNDGYIAGKTAGTIQEVLAPKVFGAINLDEATRGHDLDFFVLFSSATGVMGNAGQSDYTAANGFLDWFAATRNRRVADGNGRGRTISIDWPLWLDGGMRFPPDRLEAMMRTTGLVPMRTDAGLDMFFDSLSSEHEQWLPLQGDAARIRAWLAESLHPVRRRAVASTPAVTQAVTQNGVATAEGMRDAVLQHLVALFAEATERSADVIDPQDPMENYGLDSIIINKLNLTLTDIFPTLAKTVFFEHRTLAALCEHLLTRHADACRAWVLPADVVAMPGPPADRAVQERAQPAVAMSSPTVAVPVAAPAREPIAIVGVSGRYPGADDLDAFWRNLRDGRDCIGEIPADRWSLEGFFEPDVDLAIERGQSYSRWGGFLEGFADFDPLFFNISPREAMNVDPQERLFLQECWRTLESAGYTRDDLKSRFGGRIGVFAGITKAGYQLYTLHPTLDGEPFLPYTSFCSTANRVSYFLDIAGPSMPVDTMCSSSLTAIHEACEHILRNECAMAFAGGVNLYLHPHTYAWLSSQHMLSRDGRCRSFGAGGEGFVPGEGVGVVLLKRLSDAERDGDPIHGVILATQVNHGGRTHGYTVPNPNAQAAVIRAAIEAAGITPEAIGYIETHGTGTELGDPIEVTGLQHAFDLDASGGHRCRIGAVKSNIGHLESASGIAGLTKVLLQMRHGQLAPSLHAETLNPNIDWTRSIFEVNTRLEAWCPTLPGKPRIAGISSFGASGANAHVIVQEYVRRTPATPSATSTETLLVPLSARTAEQLAQRARDLVAFVREATVAPDLAALAYTLQTGREAMEERFCARVRSLDELVEALQAYIGGATVGERFQTGQVAANRDAMRVFARDEDFRETLQRWMARRKLDRLAELWTRGLDLDWRGLHAGVTPTRLSLPTYPFARERLWIDTRVQPVGETATAARVLHPLVHANISDLHRQAYASVLVGSESCLRDHIVGGDRILPAVAYLEMVRKAMSLALPGSEDGAALELRNTVWAQPLIVAGPHPVEIVLQPDAESGRIAFTIASAASEDTATEAVLHCQGDAAFVEDAAPDAIDLQRLAARMDRGQVDVAAVYRRFAEAGVAFGPAHRGLHRIALGSDEALADLVLPQVVSPADPAYGLHPSLMDSALQLCSCLGGDALDEAAAPLLPFALDRVRVLAPCRTDMRAWVRRVATASDHADPPKVFDIDLIDAEGRVCVQMHGFSARARADAGRRETGPRMHALVPVWNRVVPERDRHPAPKRVLVAGNEAALQWVRRTLPGAEALPADVLADADALAARLRDGCDHVLWVASDALDAEQGTETDIAIALAGLHDAFRLVKAALPQPQPPRWTFVTRRTQAVFPHDRIAPCHGAIAGFVGSLGREYPEWDLRLLDVETLDALEATDCIGLAGDAPVRCLAHRDGAWFERGLAAFDAQPASHAGYRQGGTYVVIGGAGGIGEAWSREMIERFDARLVWIGRRPLDAGIAARIDALGRLGHAPDYHSADATDLEALRRVAERIQAQHPAIHGVVHSAIDLRDQGLAQMDEAELERAVAAKMAVAVNLDTVFGACDLDFALFFSSMISFTTGAGQANYAAGSTFADSFALALAQRRPYPVKIMNWGYWGGVGVVADAFHLSRMRQMGIGSLEAPEAMAALRTLVDAPSLSQMAVIKALEPQALDAFVLPEHVGGRSRMVASRLPEAVDAARIALALPTEAVLRDDLPGEEVDALSTELLVSTLASLGIAGTDVPAEALARIDPAHARWLETSLRVAKDFGRAPRDVDALWREWDAKRPRWLANPRREAQLRLLETCLRALPSILSGARAATDVIFPNASMDLVQGVYHGNALADGCNNAVGESLVAWLQRQPSSDRFRILEIGAGTGGTTRNLLPRLAPFGDRLAEYCYTDLSKAFLIHAETQFRAQCPALNPKIFDVSRPPAEQGIDAGRYDVVVATNVLHATSDIRRTLRHAKAVLRPGGIVLINEMTGWSLARHLTFGLLEGWWLYEDAGLREPGSPGLAVETWQRLLVDEGFDAVSPVVPEAHALGQCVLAAASDGLWRQRVAKPTATATRLVEAAPVVAPAAAKVSSPAPAAMPAAGSLRDRCTAYLRKAVADALKLDEARVGLNRPLADYGLDSILVIGLTGQLRKAFPAIGSTLFFEARDLSELADTLLRSYPEQAERLFGVPTAPVQDATAASPAGSSAPARNLRLSSTPASTAAPAPVGTAASASTIFDVAIVGLSGRYPMANDMETFWRNLSEGRHCVSEVPADRWNWRDHDGDGPDAIYTRWGGFLDHIDRFDPLFFRISPKDAKAMDPQERLFLQACYHAIEDAGYRPDTLARPDKVGVFVGVMNARYTAQPLHYSIANRVSFALDFQGPSVAVDTACSSSLSAIHFALDSLYSGQSDCVIAGGVNLIVDAGHYRELTAVGMLSHGDRCRAFGAGADGFIDAEGVGAVVLKPLAQAERDGDLIHGVIKASAINAGGRTHGYTVPNPVAQGAVVSETLRRAGLSAADVSCIEAHGTGTALGDPIEIAGLRRAFEADTQARGFCAIGSLKSNFGHCESAAGIAALTKVLLQLRHGQLVPSLNADDVNPEIDFAQTPFRLQRTLQPWMRPVKTVDGRTVEVPRIAGISSFGAGGANAHLIVQEYVPSTLRPQPMHTERAGPVVVPLSARTADQLARKADDLLALLERARERGERLSLASLAYSLQTGREERDERLAFVADSIDSLLAALRSNDDVDRVRGRAQREAEPISDAGSRSAAELARAWVSGALVDWAGMYDTTPRPERMRLPLYPFSQESFWQPVARSLPESAPAPEPTAGKPRHPLLQRSVASLNGLVHETTFGSSGDRLGAGLRLRAGGFDGHAIPASVHLEMARSALSGLHEGEGKVIELSGATWSAPAIFDETQVLRLSLFARAGRGAGMAVGFEIGDADPEAQHGLLCQGMAKPVDAVAPRMDLAGLMARMPQGRWDREAFYRDRSAAGLDYAAPYRCLADVRLDDTQALADVRLPEDLADDVAVLGMHPVLLDGAMQAGSLLLPIAVPPSLPWRLASLRWYQPCPARTFAWVRRATVDGMPGLDIDLCDADGRICVELRGLNHGALDVAEPPAAVKQMPTVSTPATSTTVSVELQPRDAATAAPPAADAKPAAALAAVTSSEATHEPVSPPARAPRVSLAPTTVSSPEGAPADPVVAGRVTLAPLDAGGITSGTVAKPSGIALSIET